MKRRDCRPTKAIVARAIATALVCGIGLLAFTTTVSALEEAIPPATLMKQLERISGARAALDATVRTAPFSVIKATAYFDRRIPVENAPEILRGKNLALKGFRHGDKSESGGYILRNNESLDEAIQNYRVEYGRLLDRRVEMMRRLLQKTSALDTADLLQAARTQLESVQRKKAHLSVAGLQIIGVELEGSAYEMQKFRDNVSLVRAVELSSLSNAQPAILP